MNDSTNRNCTSNAEDHETPNKKARTPSGTPILINFRDIRTLFSKDACQVSEKSLPLKVIQPYHQRLRNSPRIAKNTSCSIEHNIKTVASANAKTTVSSRVSTRSKKQGLLNLGKQTTPSKDIAFEWESDSEVDNFYTPPATPKVRNNKARNLNSTRAITKYLNPKTMESSQSASSNFSQETRPKTVPSPEEGMETNSSQDESVKTLDLPTVMEMLTNINQRLQTIESNQKLAAQPQPELTKRIEKLERSKVNIDQEEVSALKQEVKELKRDNFILDRAAKMLNNTVCELNQRLSKIELNNNKKIVAITGLYLYGTKRNERIEEVQSFFETELGVCPYLDDVYTVGNANPPICVVCFSNLQEKMQVMSYKKLLKSVENKDGKSIYINDYWAADVNERRKNERELYNRNDQRAGDQKVNMDFRGPYLHIGNSTAVQAKAVKTPQPRDILDLSAQELSRILKLVINRGKEVIESNSKFTAYTAQVTTYEQINDLYLKIKLIHPVADHVICAYHVSNDDFFNTDHCDDGEHGAGRAILSYMKENDITDRVIFVVRYFGGVKLGPKRFEKITEAVRDVILQLPNTQVTGTPPKTEPKTVFVPPPQVNRQTQNQSYNKPKGTGREAIRGARPYTSSKSSQRGSYNKSYRSRQSHLNQLRGRGRGRARGSYAAAAGRSSKRQYSPNKHLHLPNAEKNVP